MFAVNHVTTQAAPPAVQRSEGRVEEDHAKPSVPWESSGPLSGLFNPKFPPSTKEKERKGRGQQRRSRSLDGDRPIRQQRRRSHSHGNMSSGNESEKTASEQCRRTKTRGCHGNQKSNSHFRFRGRSRSPDALTWKHIQKQLVEPNALIVRQMEEIPYTEVRVSGEPMRACRSLRERRHCRWASASDLHSKTELVPPLPVTKATDTSCQLPTSP
ncbi:band 4.1-like protein 4A isoform X1 [Lates calcarifer]|uniref:Band 4.1-like protein 4A isoform X1 n=1 Tax=Lates calcarifer TaxID=8187 RepID=A0AAJ8B2U8_LATCA|nr:band 4.1-like protein 4A isoform X1 [Lates calcarifer]XP_050924906.1 band 4.1-like protein 4A isoform X1 [Lates calcarifer]